MALELRRSRETSKRLKLANETLTRAAPASLVARSPAMRRVMTLIERSAPTNANVLVLGENGTGKELGIRFKGYRLDKKRQPTFLYNFDDMRIEDAFASPLCTMGVAAFMRRMRISQVKEISGRLAAILMWIDPQVGFVIYQADLREKQSAKLSGTPALDAAR